MLRLRHIGMSASIAPERECTSHSQETLKCDHAAVLASLGSSVVGKVWMTSRHT